MIRPEQGLADPDLHLFLDEREIDSMAGVTRMINPMRHEYGRPVLPAHEAWELGHIQAGRVLYDPEDDLYRCWYNAVPDLPWPYNRALCYATSRDGVAWEKPRLDVATLPGGEKTNIILLPQSTTLLHLHPYPVKAGESDIKYRAVLFQGDSHPPALLPEKRVDEYLGLFLGDELAGTPSGERRVRGGVYHATSPDGLQWKIGEAPVIDTGDRIATTYDPARGRYLLTSRHLGVREQALAGIPIQRDIDLWESADLRAWEHRGRLLRADSFDPPGTQFYSLLPVRYGPGYIGLLEVYHRDIERLDNQLCWSRDGLHWERVGDRTPVLGRGGEGDWDSHWICVTNNDPEVVGERLRFWYTGASTHHASKGKHRRAVGIASIRRDGFVSIEGRMEPGALVTARLDATEPRRLSVNLRATSGHAAIEVLGADARPLEGFAAEDCTLPAPDGVEMAVSWRGGEVVPAQPGGFVYFRFVLRLASLYAYRWQSAG